MESKESARDGAAGASKKSAGSWDAVDAVEEVLVDVRVLLLACEAEG